MNDYPCYLGQEALLASIAADALPILARFAPAFWAAVFPRAQLLALACILATGRRTVGNLLRVVAHLSHGAPSSYHRVLSCAKWSGLSLAALLTRFLVRHFWPQGPIRLVGDDTVSEHPGRKVHGKGRHRDPVRSRRRYTAYRGGHKWVVLALLVHFPFAPRPWALPVLVALYRSPGDDKARCRRHKTPAPLVQLLLGLVLRWFPDRPFVFAGDSGYGSHEMAGFARKAQGRLRLVSKFPADANLFEPAPAYKGKGRPRVRGAKLPGPQQVVAKAARVRRNVAWYGGGRRDVAIVSGVGHWYKGGQGLVAVRWGYVHDRTGTHRDDYFSSTDVTMTEQEILERSTQRWNRETTFAAMRAYLGLETTRGRCAKTVRRAEPCLCGLPSVVAVADWPLPAEAQEEGGVEGPGKRGVTFSDALGAVRRWRWTNWVLPRADHELFFV